MSITVRYIGTQQRWPELAATEQQSVWNPGQVEEREDVEALALLDTGYFERVDTPIQFPVFTVATLPTAASWAGARAFVADADTPVTGEAPIGDGDVMASVWSNGTGWVIG